MNKIILIGNLTRDPELRSVNTANGPVSVCSFTIAVNRRNRGSNQQNEADFFRITTWRGQADSCAKFLAKGRKVSVIGSVSCSTYQAQDGTTRASMEVNAEDVEFLSSSQGQSNGDNAASAPAAQSLPGTAPAAQSATPPGFTAVETDELPF